MKNRTFLMEALTFFAALLLLIEWLGPIAELTNIGYIRIFYIFVAISFLLQFLKTPWWLSGFLKIAYIYWFIVSIYSEHPVASSDSIRFFISEIFYNIGQLVALDLTQMTDPFRTILFFVLLWMTVYLIGYWIRMRATLFIFFVLTVTIIGILDTFTPYDGSAAIVRVFVIGLGVSALLFLFRLHQEQKKINYLGVAFTAGVLLVSVAAAIVLPKAGPLWPDPVPYFYSSNPDSGIGAGGGSSINKVGYDENDEQLGGSFLSDDTEVFQVRSTSRNYYRVETKDTYTSKGWIQSEPQLVYDYYQTGEAFSLDFPPSEDEEGEQLAFDMQSEFPFLFHTYGATAIASDVDNFDVRFNQSMNRFDAVNESGVVNPESYVVDFAESYYLLSDLRSTAIEDLGQLGSEFAPFLQLPDTLPQRVRDLALEITAEQQSVYDQAKAIEQYFRSNGFTYSQNDVAVPEDDTDYVDQFLFDTKLGYCDNFSTSMVVLLRAADIPARWVKGFAPGEVIETENGEQVFQVTNNNAHSWVEAYLPGIGWMNFEPTIGFTNTPDIEFDIELSPDDALAAEQQEIEQQQQQEQELETPEQSSANESSFSIKPFTDWLADKKWWLIGLLAVLLVVGGALIKWRLKWLPKVMLSRYSRSAKTEAEYEKMYQQLLRYLTLYGLPKEPGFTLSRYAAQIDNYFGGDHMKKLTSQYERQLYGKAPLENPDHLRESWEYLINRLSG
ncbi:transglutaminase domain-containing protein [Chryseomicrobium sp. FSL W7-1435]|uniref:transglutaminase domain-containing protein n=1 Tax=Chryseomicrobium sp. FSL W7-1435 TaxID=2921704 RepID=UPI00315AFA64